jgi:hypothetical protein
VAGLQRVQENGEDRHGGVSQAAHLLGTPQRGACEVTTGVKGKANPKIGLRLQLNR